jgi:ubiquinone/menaquinone biosynthesis C-methylase UbiE
MSGALSQFADGAAYEQLMGRWSQIAGATFLDWLGLPKGLTWLDVGCGNGAFTETLIAKNAPREVIGIDPSEGQLAYARTRPGTKLAKFQMASAQDLPFSDNSFDVAVMPLVITFVPDPVKAVGEMKRVVRSGGMIAAYMWDIPGGGLPLEPSRAAMRSMGEDEANPPGFQASREDRMRAVWEQNELTEIETRVIRIRITYASFEDFWKSNSVPVGPSGVAIAKLSADKKEELKNLLRQRLPAHADGAISYEPFANAVKGRVCK